MEEVSTMPTQILNERRTNFRLAGSTFPSVFTIASAFNLAIVSLRSSSFKNRVLSGSPGIRNNNRIPTPMEIIPVKR